MTNSTSKIYPGDEYVTVAGEDILLSCLSGGDWTREERAGTSWMTSPDGSLSYRIKVRQAHGWAKRRAIEVYKAAAAARLARQGLPASYTSIAEMQADWK